MNIISQSETQKLINSMMKQWFTNLTMQALVSIRRKIYQGIVLIYAMHQFHNYIDEDNSYVLLSNGGQTL